MEKLIYPGIFYKENDGYWVEFPGLEGCQSHASTLAEIYENAREALELYCAVMVDAGEKLPTPIDITTLKLESNAFTSLVSIHLNKNQLPIERVLTIPVWLNDLAEKNKIDLSEVLEQTLVERLVG